MNAKKVSDLVSNLDAAATNGPIPYPALAGWRLKSVNGGLTYLVNPQGYRQAILDDTTYANLFTTSEGIVPVLDIDSIAEGPSFTPGSILARGDNNATVYLITDGKRWGISSVAVMTQYHFKFPDSTVPMILLDFIPNAFWA
ncbi:hypothetical protein [Synoicihabitans lomoniglobus]|uniref:Uncharacterized protein n=1 Tax=Synoicihabitans lomoniglobus TaxID=2909285 RepID=A0AAE9ZU69_9BACT|nr:hypothetical protein [Opitutaceae bacterium LMO-M01]WED63356.1 hypothetical protein PXH66_13540 [Opitutaceae bacterium LMO-M01]